MKKLLALITCLSMVAVLACSCSGGGDSGSEYTSIKLQSLEIFGFQAFGDKIARCAVEQLLRLLVGVEGPRHITALLLWSSTPAPGISSTTPRRRFWRMLPLRCAAQAARMW